MFAREAYRTQERRRGLVVVAALIGGFFLLLSWLSQVWTDYLWFSSVGYVDTFRTNLLATLAVGAAGFVVVFAFVLANLTIAAKLAPRFATLELGPDEEVVERFRQWAEPYGRRLWAIAAAVVGMLLGTGLTARRDTFLLFFQPVSFGINDPQFGTDISFYVFRLPFWQLLVSFGTNVVVFTSVLVVAVHFLNGGARIGAGGRPVVRSGVKAHLSALAAAFALIRAAGYHLDRFELLFQRNNGFFGGGFTDITARLPALNLLVLVAIVAAVLLLWNIRRSGWTLAWVSIGGWVLVSVLAGAIYPEAIQRFRVDNDPFVREQIYIERNIMATRDAYDVDDVEVRPYDPRPNLTAADIEANSTTFENLRLWDPDVLTRTYQKNQEIRPYYRIDQVDTDRYIINGEPRQVMIAIRELEDGNPDIPSDWQNQRLLYTHGFGAVVNEAAVVSAGQPEFIVKDVPPVVSAEGVTLDQPRIYFGETYDPRRPVIVRTGSRAQEVDFPLSQGSAEYEYQGEGGVVISSWARKAAFALRYRDLNLLISPQIRSDSRVLMHRNIRSIVQELAPFLRPDADPYPVLSGGKVIWVLDLYTISSGYPYSEPIDGGVGPNADTRRMRRLSGLPGGGGFNYIRNSVKATVDAFDGSVRFYIVDQTDPVIQAWAQVYPEMFTTSPLPNGLVEHLRYPQDLFTLQSEIYRDYHMDDVNEFFRRVDPWQVTKDPSSILRRPAELLYGDEETAAGARYLSESLPTYLFLRLPGEEEPSYVLSQTFNPAGKINLASVLMADSTPGEAYGRLVDYRLPRGSAVEGGGQVGERIDQDDQISAQFTLWGQQGSDVVLGDMLVLPVEESMVYIQPVFLAAESGGLPEFRRVIVVYGDLIEWGDTLPEALNLVFGTSPVEGEPTDDNTVEELLSAAALAFDQARVALGNGNLSEYQRWFEEAERLVDQATELLSSAPQASRFVSVA